MLDAEQKKEYQVWTTIIGGQLAKDGKVKRPNSYPRYVAIWGIPKPTHVAWLRPRFQPPLNFMRTDQLGPWVFGTHFTERLTLSGLDIEVAGSYARVSIRAFQTGPVIVPLGRSWSVSSRYIVGLYSSRDRALKLLNQTHNTHL